MKSLELFSMTKHKCVLVFQGCFMQKERFFMFNDGILTASTSFYLFFFFFLLSTRMECFIQKASNPHKINEGNDENAWRYKKKICWNSQSTSKRFIAQQKHFFSSFVYGKLEWDFKGNKLQIYWNYVTRGGCRKWFSENHVWRKIPVVIER